jgi:hypothetical protein
VTRRSALIGAIAIAIAASGCGSDDSGDTTVPSVSIPAITNPLEATTTPPPTTTTPPTTTGRGGKTYNPKQPDSETNDLPPPAGSPQEAFEKQCEQNPQACG